MTVVQLVLALLLYIFNVILLEISKFVTVCLSEKVARIYTILRCPILTNVLIDLVQCREFWLGGFDRESRQVYPSSPCGHITVSIKS
jgi:hypothetical protein